MASTILYKFRSGTNFESLPLPGTSARLFDIKRAIVRAKKLDRSATGSGLEFDFSIQNATTNEVYEDESMVLPRGTRIIVRRVAAEKNQGLLSRIARAEVSGGVPPPMMGAGGGAGGAAQNGFYTIRSRDRDGEDEFLDEEPPQQAVPSVSTVDESKELEALKAVTDQASMYGSGMPRNSNSQMNKVWSAGGGGSGGGAGGGIAGSGPPRGGAPHFSKPPQRSRPNADPELREQELRQQPQTKKRATGIPRTFLSLNAPSNAAAPGAEGDLQNENTGENAADGGGLASQLQPNTIGFEALVNRAGGQSIGASGKRRDLDYALKLTATSIPEHLLCGICNSVVKNAMLIPWDTEGRPCCESCIRDSLTQNGFKCPLTGTEGVSPDDLFANVGLRKAADLFVQGVMAKMDQIEKQIEAEEAEEEKNLERAGKNNDFYEGEGGDRGILVTRSMSKQNGKKRQEDDLLGEEDEFGGDVFDVCGDDDEAEEAVENVAESSNDKTLVSHASKPVGIDIDSSSAIDNNNKSEPKDHTVSGTQDQNGTSSNVENNTESKGAPNEMINNISANSNEPLPRSQTTDPATAQQANSNGEQGANKKSTPVENAASSSSSRPSHYRREVPKRRGPPAGYVLGPAGGGMAASSSPAAKGPMAAHAMGSFVPGSFPPPPPPPPPVGGRGANVMGAPSHMGRGNNGGGRFPQNQYGPRDPFHGGRGGRNMMPPDQQQQQYPDQRQQQQHYGGYGDSGRGRQHSHQGRGSRFNRRQEQQDQHWGENRKRPRDAMDGNPMQEATQQGWGGSGPQYAGGRNHFDGRGGGFNGGGRGRAGGFRGRGGGRGYGRGGRF